MESLLGIRSNIPDKPSPLEGFSSPVQAQADLGRLARREWWLWFSTTVVTLLCGAAFLLTAFPSLFRNHDHFYELGSAQARWATLCLLLLFNAWMVYRQRSFRRMRRQIPESAGEPATLMPASSQPGGLDPVTGLLTRTAAELHLGKEIGRAKRENVALSLATFHLDDLPELTQKYGAGLVEQALKEFARKLKEASRGSDYAVRLATDDFVLVLPKCNLGEVRRVLDRVGPLNLNCSGKKFSLSYTTGWVDYQPGDMPSDLLKRASNLLHLYDSAAKGSQVSLLASR